MSAQLHPHEVHDLHPAKPQGPKDAALSIFDATVELLDAGQDVVVNRIEMLRAELKHDAQQLATAIGAVLAASFVLSWGYAFLVVAATWGLARLIDPPLAIALVGLLHAAGGAGLLFVATKRLNHLSLPNPDEEP
jgi:hypothetical protein